MEPSRVVLLCRPSADVPGHPPPVRPESAHVGSYSPGQERVTCHARER